MSNCDKLPDEIKGKSVEQIPELRRVLEMVSCDPKKWVTIYKCRLCGQMWEERYVPTGHGDMPILKKVYE